MGKTLYFIFVASCTAALAGCNGTAHQAVPDADLVGTLWTLESIELPGEPDIIVGSSETVNIQFSETNRIEGSSFCNAYGSSYTLLEDNNISIDIIGSTKKGCKTEEKAHGEATYFWALPLVNSYEIEGNELRLYFDDSVLEFRNVE